MYAVGFVGTASSWILMKHFGRRDIYVYGQVVLVSLMLIVGSLGAADRESENAQWAIGGLLIVFAATYQFTVGPVCYSIVAEISSTRLRSKTVVLARNLYNIGGIIVGFLNPYMLNSTEVRTLPLKGIAQVADFFPSGILDPFLPSSGSVSVSSDSSGLSSDCPSQRADRTESSISSSRSEFPRGSLRRPMSTSSRLPSERPPRVLAVVEWFTRRMSRQNSSKLPALVLFRIVSRGRRARDSDLLHA